MKEKRKKEREKHVFHFFLKGEFFRGLVSAALTHVAAKITLLLYFSKVLYITTAFFPLFFLVLGKRNEKSPPDLAVSRHGGKLPGRGDTEGRVQKPQRKGGERKKERRKERKKEKTEEERRKNETKKESQPL